MIRALLVWLALTAGSLMSTTAQAGVICSFGGSGLSGVDCLGQTWVVQGGGWGIPGIGNGSIPFGGSQTATDFHFHCLTGCGKIQNGALDDTRFSLAPLGTTFWDEALNAAADTIDFSAPSLAADLTPGRIFFVNITVPITSTAFSFEAWWTNDLTSVPEPTSMALVGAAALALGLSRRRRQPALKA